MDVLTHSLVARLVVILCLVTSPAALRAREPGEDLEYQVKAAYLYNFFKFVYWPQRNEPPGAPVQVCVVGQDPFGPILDQTFAQKTIAGRLLHIVRLPDPEHSEGCRVVFFGEMPKKELQKALKCLEGAPVLTVGESDEFLHFGGIVQFRIEDRKVRFEIQADAARRAGLRISAQLLELGRAGRH